MISKAGGKSFSTRRLNDTDILAERHWIGIQPCEALNSSRRLKIVRVCPYTKLLDGNCMVGKGSMVAKNLKLAALLGCLLNTLSRSAPGRGAQLSAFNDY